MRTRPRGLLFVYVVIAIGGLAVVFWRYDGVVTGDVSDTLVSLLSLLATVWGTLSAKRTLDKEKPLADIADALAGRVRQQWEAAEDIHRLNDDYPMTVAWADENDGLTASLSEVRAMAAAMGAGRTDSSPPDTLAGEGAASLVTMFQERVPTGRLVMLGERGSGKTVLLEQFIYLMLQDRPQGGAVHVRFPLGHWPLKGVGLGDWMATYLMGMDPTLSHHVAGSRKERVSRAEALLRAGLVVPVFDGYDELPAGARATVLESINDSLRIGERIILSSRPDEYREAVVATHRPLKGAPGIVLRPMSAGQAEQYLDQRKGDWDELRARLGTDTPVGQALSSPLTLFLCRTAYEYRSGALPSAAPSELCDQDRFPTESAVRAHVFTRFLPAVYRSTGGPADSPWSEAEAAQTLGFLARHRQNTEAVVGAGTDLSWWKLHHFTPRVRKRLTWCLALAFATPLLPLAKEGWRPLLLSALLAALFVGCARSTLNSMSFTRSPAVGLRWRWRWVPAGVGAFFGWVSAVALAHGGTARFGVAVYLTHIALFTLVGGALFSWSPRTADLNRPVTPRDLLRQDRRAFFAHVVSWSFAVTLFFAVFLGLAFAYDQDIAFRSQWGDLLLLSVQQLLAPLLLVGMAIGVPIAFSRTACGPFALACLWYGLLRRTPFRLLAFLEDAHRRGVLRQVGGSYEFRHVELQRHLAGAR